MSGIKPGISQKLQLLTAGEIEQLHDTSINILLETGVLFENERALKVLSSHGVKLDGQRALFQPKLVEKAIESSPERVVLHARNSKYDVVLGEGNVHYTSCYGPVSVRRPGAKKTVPGTLEDLRNFTVLSDALDNVSYCLFHVRPHEVPQKLHDVYCAAEMLKITSKHVHFSQDSAVNTDILIQLGNTAAADASINEGPVFSMGCCPTTPLRYTEDACERFMAAVPEGIPFLIVSGAMAGGTSPATLAGTLAVQNAEILAGVVFAQLIKPGAPVIYGSFSGGMEMRSGNFVMGGAELALMQAATVQICGLYKIPFGYGSGGWTDAPEPGIQAGFEKACTLLTPAMAGVEVIHSAHGGMLGGARIADYAQMMIDDELCSMINRYIRGIEISKETLAFDLIRETGPGGNFLDTPHTAKLFRGEHFLPRLLSRTSNEGGEKDLLEKAEIEVKNILATHQPDRLSTAASRRMDEIVKRAVDNNP